VRFTVSVNITKFGSDVLIGGSLSAAGLHRFAVSGYRFWCLQLTIAVEAVGESHHQNIHIIQWLLVATLFSSLW
jgi:hypothetical protein